MTASDQGHVEFRPVDRGVGAFQEPVTVEQVQAMCRRVFGDDVGIRRVVELGGGMYNSTYRVEADGLGGPVVLRVAPEAAKQYRVERALMRNEQASVPWLAPIAALMPRTLAVDFTGEVIGRDWMVQSWLDGVPAPEGLGGYARELWGAFFAEMGGIAGAIHSVRGERFGPVAGPWFATWGEAVLSSLGDTAADLHDAGLDAADVGEVTSAVEDSRSVLDEIVEPRLLSGDLWTPNVMIAAEASEPRITGVFDLDRTSWGDPAADWTIFMIDRRPGRETFWDAYGTRPATPEARWRSLVYKARHIGAIRLERHRLGRRDALGETYDQMRDVLHGIRGVTQRPTA